MAHKLLPRWLLLAALLISLMQPAAAQAFAPQAQAQVTAYDLIIAMNTLRTSYGLPALIEDPIIDAVAQSTAEIMAANQMSWHIGDVSGRIQSAGYGGGAKVWATENFAAGNMSIDEIMVVWSDDSHMIPAVNPAYCHVGAGIAQAANGMYYYVLQAAYTSANACGEYRSPSSLPTQSSSSNNQNRPSTISQLIVPVKIATPDASGKIFHVVEAGQSFWAIAVAYQVTIKDIETWNNISKDSKLQIGQKLFIPSKDTAGYATPTPIGMIQPAKPDADGKIIHTVALYNTLSTIATAYNVTVENILSLNGWQLDWPLQIGQKLIIDPGNVTPTPTPRPLTPIERLTPAADGRYYHTVNAGETLSWIAGYYQVNLNDLMAWNNLNAASIIKPADKLLLQVTPPATITPTPEPATLTPTVTITPSPTNTLHPTVTAVPPTPTPQPLVELNANTYVGLTIGASVILGLFLVIFFSRKRAG
ncbi:MAG TPA: LysM peptidoglycan-binding domain-containing protein [Anaerolineaceae bacterium]